MTFGPERWAIEITKVLNLVLGPEHFPIDVIRVAREYTAQRYPGDAITMAHGANLPGFDGALFPAPAGKAGWGIIYNNALASPGRINFTLAHEFGHYLLHRADYPNGIRCGEQDVVRWDSAYGQIEYQANRFAATLLMPLDDFRRQIAADAAVDLDLISHCADRYRVSRIAYSCHPPLAYLYDASSGFGGIAGRFHSLVAGQRYGAEDSGLLSHFRATD